MNFTVDLNGRTQTVSSSQLRAFASSIQIDRIAEGRYSQLFILDLMIYSEMRVINPFQVIDEIKSMEGPDKSRTKPPSKFRNKPLKGLWHKHYFTARFIAKNIQNHLRGGKLELVIRDSIKETSSPDAIDEFSRRLAHKVVSESFDQRAGNKKLTGEWIIFSKHNDQNYYLSMATHDMKDELTYARIKTVCFSEFPFLKSIMNE